MQSVFAVQARNATLEELGSLHPCRYLLHDRDSKFCESFREVLKAGGVKPLKLPARSQNLNAFAERWVRSIKEECLSRLILFDESSLRRAVTSFAEHYHRERNHQGKENVTFTIKDIAALDQNGDPIYESYGPNSGFAA